MHGNVLFEGKDVPKAEWLVSVNRNIVVRSPVECAIRCNKMYEANMSCNSITFDNSDNICTLGWYQKSPSREPGLRVAWASSVRGDNFPWYAIDKKIGDAFFSTVDWADDYPWLAIDLVRPEKVNKVEIKSRSRKKYKRRTHDIEVRAGLEKPFARDTNGDTLYTINTVCGFNAGPANDEADFIIECSTPIDGRYVTVQRIKTSEQPALNIVEVLLETEPLDATVVETVKVLERPSHNVERPSHNGQCRKEYPFAYEGGSRCCNTGFDDPNDLDGVWRNGFLNFDSKGCNGNSQPCPLGCMNYQYQTYLCYALDGVGTKNTKNLGPKITTSAWKECEDYAKEKKADGFIWNGNGACWPKKGNVTLEFDKPAVKRMGLIPCPKVFTCSISIENKIHLSLNNSFI